MGERDLPVTRYEFELYRREQERRIARLEGEVQELEDQHDQDMAALATQRESDRRSAAERHERRREWTWGQLAATAAAAAALGGLWLQALGR